LGKLPGIVERLPRSIAVLDQLNTLSACLTDKGFAMVAYGIAKVGELAFVYREM
jgi:hypothetical protein